MTKSKWKKTVKTKIEEKANEIYQNEYEKLRKLKCLNQDKTNIKRERYIDILQQKQAKRFKLTTRMINVRSSFKKRWMINNIYLQNVKN